LVVRPSPTPLGQPTAFNLAVSPAGGTAYRWRLGDGNTAEGSRITHTYGAPGRYPVQLDVVPGAAAAARYEAESAVLSGGVLVAADHAGYSGTGYADYPTVQGTNVAVTWNFNLPEAMWAALSFRYANGSGAGRPLHLVTNSGSAVSLPFAAGTGWADYRTQGVPGLIRLPAGANSIVLRASNGSVGPNIDYIDIAPTVFYEAELAELSPSLSVLSVEPGFSGTGYVNYSQTGPNVRLRYVLDVPQAQTVRPRFRYANGTTAERRLNLRVNGATSAQTVAFAPTGASGNYGIADGPELSLTPGRITLDLVADAGTSGPNLDALLLPFSGAAGSVSFMHVVHRPLTSGKPRTSSPLALDTTRGTLWVANPDTGSVTRVRASDLTVLGEHPVGEQPENLAVAPDGRVWVVNHGAASLTVLDSVGRTVATHRLPYGSRPFGLVLTPDGSKGYLTLQALGQVVRFDTTTGAIEASVTLPPSAEGLAANPRGLALDATGGRLLVTRFLSPNDGGLVHEIETSGFTMGPTYQLAADPGPDTSTTGRGMPNYLVNLTISPDGTRAWVPSKKDNLQRGSLRDGQPLTHDQAVRSITSVLDLDSRSELLAERTDYDNQDRCHAVAFSAWGDVAFVTQPGNNLVSVVDTYTRRLITQVPVGRAPTGVLHDPATERLYVLNFLDRTLAGFSVAGLLDGSATQATALGAPTRLVATERLSATVLRGKQLFYDATSTRLNMEGYMSCASCHLDGAHDGRTWDFTGSGEGLRNTIDLRGRAGTAHGRLHWSGNFDEVQDFENQIRSFGAGTGLMTDTAFHTGTRAQTLGDPKAGHSQDLDALAAYVSSLNRVPASPYRQADGSLTPEAVAGREVYRSLNCASCHGGEGYTDSPGGALHDVGTLRPSSGKRLGGTLTGLDTPTLRGVWDTAPYFHDGSAPDLATVLTTGPQHAVTATLGATKLAQLIAFLRQIDGEEPVATVEPATIRFDAVPAKALGDPPFVLTASASSGLPVEFVSSTPSVATVTGQRVTLHGVGQTLLTAQQPGNAVHPAATPVAQPLVVSLVHPSFASYRASYFSAADLADPQRSGPLVDFDGDGVCNLLEYALGGTDPTNSAAVQPVRNYGLVNTGTPQVVVSFLRRSGGSTLGASYFIDDLAYQALGSRDLIQWDQVPVQVPNPPGLMSAPAGYEWVSYALPAGLPGSQRGFLKLQVN
jgi:YVTN family beta-propeller protein